MIYIYLSILLFMSLITFVAYANDKKKAIKDPRHRTREKTLLLLSFFFGAIGGLFGMYGCHHKTKHWYFVVINWVSLIIQIVLLGLIYKYFKTGYTLV